MATIRASQFVSTSAHINCRGTSTTLVPLPQIGFRNQFAVTHHGLRCLNKVDMLKMRGNVNAITSKATRTKGSTVDVASCKESSVIRCTGGMMKLVFVGAEVSPWSKTGGLGDVLGGLPPAMAANGHRVMTVSPRYDQYSDAWDTSVLIDIKVGDRVETVRFFHCYKQGVDRVFVDHPLFLEKVWGKTGSKIYGPRAGEDYKDNQIRFSLLCQAALEAPRVLNLNSSSNHFSGPYGDEDVLFICNDWHTALLPCYLKTMYKSKGIYTNAKVAFCIHNISYQGRFPFSEFSLLNLPDEFRGSFDFVDGNLKPVKGRKINWMKAGILESDQVLTVSPYYAQELVSGMAKGVELDNIIRKTGITGIVNGMDVEEWNPAADKYISIRYNAATVMDAKPLLKEALQAEVGLPVDRNIPVIGFIGRLEEQKGLDILSTAIPKFIQENVQIIVLGTGKKSMEKQLEQLEIKYPEKARGIAKFNVHLAHMIIAGADYMLIPSRFEPCGLIQLHAMRYGTMLDKLAKTSSCVVGLCDKMELEANLEAKREQLRTTRASLDEAEQRLQEVFARAVEEYKASKAHKEELDEFGATSYLEGIEDTRSQALAFFPNLNINQLGPCLLSQHVFEVAGATKGQGNVEQPMEQEAATNEHVNIEAK
ncbi:PREDICTED: granule-bound starch synthase 1, chloroplastic/amyloplastic-like [Nelumbo nucifera]|uniref:Granule-bound starch synthase 1, chloroplastic/amyloplastic-like n=1 Tax=Nelumbo nucifera TaxID=4432 RepID=A0A1U8AK42_NELNU|nr:PREDICTED: granule-bound starch synthase 1, chloroplastic/amyloplastic-like [Nelumbo nucifera]